MAIQILGLRDNPRFPQKKRTVFFANKWRVDSVNEIFEKISHIIEQIPATERHNMYFTVADCFEEDGRKLKEQHVIPFDIDHLSGETTEDVKHQAILAAKAACEAIGVTYVQTGVIFSGNGVQLFVQIPKPILSEDYFELMRPHYKVVCDRIQAKLVERGISGKLDTSVFSTGRLMRLPNTENRKPNKPTRLAEILNGTMVPQEFYLDQVSGITDMQKPDQINMDVVKRYPEPDAKAVMEGCGFVKHCFDNPKDVSEPQWYAAGSIVVRLYKDEDKSKELFHKMSEGHPGYSYYETELKANQALENAGPRTCRNIQTLWDGCAKCPHYGTNLISPILIHGPDYIKSKDFGFREMKMEKSGNMVPGKPAYDDLIKQFSSEFEYINLLSDNRMYIFDKHHWREYSKKELRLWITHKVHPSPSSSEIEEFCARIDCRNLRKEEWLFSTIEGMMNFENGVLNIETGELVPHSSNYAFMHVIPYAYDKDAECPRWDKFMNEVTASNKKMIDLLHEFAGYAIAGGECAAQKALILLGEGANGKSLWADTVAKVVGDRNFSSLFLNDLGMDQMRARLKNKLFNYCDEGSGSLRESNEFKALVSGGVVTAKEVYKPAFEFRNKAKLIILTNNLPSTNDTSNGFFRRCIIVPFDQKFEGPNADRSLNAKLWAELPGICKRFIEGYKRLRERLYIFDEPEISRERLEEYEIESNTASVFAQECLTVASDHTKQVALKDVYARYTTWCMSGGIKPDTIVWFAKKLRRSKFMLTCEFSRDKKGAFIRGAEMPPGDY